MNTPIETPKLSKEDGTSSRSVGRRRFLGAGAAVAPVILSMVSQPALGATCFSPSRAISRNTSISQQGFYGECNGQSPGNYSAQYDDPNHSSYSWGGGVTPSTPFHSAFNGNVYWVPEGTVITVGNGGNAITTTVGVGGRSLTMLEVLMLPNGAGTNFGGKYDPNNVAKHLVAAYINIKRGLIPTQVLNESSLMDIWAEWLSSNFTRFTPTGGVTWSGTQIVAYLTSNGIAP